MGDGRAKDESDDRAIPVVREAQDAAHHDALQDDPGDESAKLDIGLDESFPTSDPPAVAAPGAGEPAISSGFDEEAERKIIERRQRAYAIWEREGRPEGRDEEHWRAAGDETAPEPGTAPWTEGP
jgi:hypothetical protein